MTTVERHRWPAKLEDTIDARGGDGEQPALQPLNPAVLAKVPHVERDHTIRAGEQALDLHDPDTRFLRAVAAGDVQDGEEGEPDLGVRHQLIGRRLLVEEPPAALPRSLVAGVEARPLFGVGQDSIRIDMGTWKVGIAVSALAS